MNYDFRTGWLNRPDASREDFEAKAPYVDNGTAQFDPARYYDPAFMKAEWDRLWPKVWLLAGPESDIPDAGDYFRFNIGPESFIVVRGDDGQIRAHYNVCPHRGTALVQNDFGNLAKFSCPFHGWQFGLDGKNIRVVDQETFRPEVLCHGIDLTPVRCESIAGIVFLTMNENAVPLRDYLGVLAEQIECYRSQDMKVITHTQSVWGANWKVGADAFYEIYHVPHLHPESVAFSDYRAQIDLYPNGMSRMIIKQGSLPPAQYVPDQVNVCDAQKLWLKDAGVDPEAFSGTADDVRPAIQAAKRERAARHGIDYSHFSDTQLSDGMVYGIFPNVQFVCHPEAIWMHRWLPDPDNPNLFLYDTMSLAAFNPSTPLAPPFWFGIDEDTDMNPDDRPDIRRFPLGQLDIQLIINQDAGLMPYVQAGVRSRGFKGGVWSEQESRLRHMHTEIDRYVNGEK